MSREQNFASSDVPSPAPSPLAASAVMPPLAVTALSSPPLPVDFSAEVACAKQPGYRFGVRVEAPQCWDGVNLDSADHKSHLAYSVRRRGGGRDCPPSHPVEVPKISMHVTYPVAGGPGVTLASGPSYTEHADFFNAWDPPTLDQLVMRCLRADVKCEGTT